MALPYASPVEPMEGMTPASRQRCGRRSWFIGIHGLSDAPGLIDLHEHGQADENHRFQARGGVTTSLELELGTDDVNKWYAGRQSKALINYGVSAGHIPMRIRVMAGQEKSSLSTMNTAVVEAANHRELSADELSSLRAVLEEASRRGRCFYNPRRRHSTLNYVSPTTYEGLQAAQKH